MNLNIIKFLKVKAIEARFVSSVLEINTVCVVFQKFVFLKPCGPFLSLYVGMVWPYEIPVESP